MKILIVEDEPLIAEDIAAILTRNDFQVSETAYTLAEALNELACNLPDMALLDINLNNKMDGIQIAQKIQSSYGIPFLFITSYSDKNTLEQAKLTEPAGYIVKPFNEASLCSAIEIASYNHTQKTKRQFPALQLQHINQFLQDPLSEREFDLLKLIYEGKTNKQIADELFISGNTVKKHINNTYLKLDTVSRATTLVKLRELMMQV
jgi:DNA-binding NarL/FixJ family response regulator